MTDSTNTGRGTTTRRSVLGRTAAGVGVFGGVMAGPADARTDVSRANGTPDLVVPVISDTHVERASEGGKNQRELREALSQLNDAAPRSDVIVVLGDFTDNGYTEEYDRFDEAFRTFEEAQQDATSLFAIGNHEYFGPATDEAQQRFLDRTGMPSIYYHEVVNGYHFIVLGTEDDRASGTFSAEQIEWLDDQLALAEADTPDRPIFVFHHQPLQDTVYGDEWGIEKNGDELYDTLREYPQVISFSGHTHYPMDDPRIVHQRDFTAVGTGTIETMWVPSGRKQGEVPPDADVLNQGLVVEVRGADVVIRRRDFHADSWTDDPLGIDPFGEFTYTDDRDRTPPEFPDDACLSIASRSPTELEIEIPQATDDRLTHDYRVRATDRITGVIVREFLAFSEFYRDPVPDPLSLTVDELTPGTPYEIEVWAIDSFDNESERALRTEGRTSPRVRTLSESDES